LLVRRLAAGAPCLHREGKACAAVAALIPPAISLTASQSDALLQAMAIHKASLLSTLLQHWVSWTGETLTPGAGLQVTVSLVWRKPETSSACTSIRPKTQIHALDRTQPMLPMGFGYVEGVTHDYIRLGTNTLFAALDVATGAIRRGGASPASKS
jgi:hypothetical protein